MQAAPIIPPILNPTVYANVLEALQPKHALYCRTVSSAKMAMSLELATLICALDVGNKDVLELGSGFSSWALRKYEANVESVDTDAPWLQKSMDFCEVERGFYLWEDFWPTCTRTYDMVVQDIGGMDRRANTLQWVWDRLRPGGWLVLDDVHKAKYRAAVDRFLPTVEHHKFDVEVITTDSFGRYGYLVRKTA